MNQEIPRAGPPFPYLHSWAAVGWELKSPLYFYDIASDNNGKTTQDIDQILEPYILP